MGLLLAILSASPAWALGLGPASGNPILGQPLQLQIPLLGVSGRPPESKCVFISQSTTRIDNDYLPRDVRSVVDTDGGSPRLLITTTTAVRQPIIEFQVFIACGFNVSRDYLLMVELPPTSVARPAPQPAPAQVAIAVPVQTAGSAGLPDGVAQKEIILERAMTLEDLGDLHYQGQPIRRGRFMRWVVEANPGLFAGSADPKSRILTGGTQLLIPAVTPPRRPGDYADKPVDLTPPGTAPSVSARVAKKPNRAKQPAAAKAERGSRDRLVLGAGGSASTPANLKEAMALLERLTGILEQQTAAQTEMAAKVEKVESAMADLGKYVVRLETLGQQREMKWEAERLAAQQANEERDKQGLVQLFLTVIAGGVLGALLVKLFDYLSFRRRQPSLSMELSPVAERPIVTAAGTPTSPTDSMPPAVQPSETETFIDVTDASAEGPFPTTDHREAVPEVMEFYWEEPPPGKVSSTPAAPIPNAIPTSDRNADAGLVPKAFDPTLELVEIMTSMGLTQGAVKTLVEHIRAEPQQSLQHWLKLLEIYRRSGERGDFEGAAEGLRKNFNVQTRDWESAQPGAARAGIEDYPHIAAQLQTLWRTADCVDYLMHLLRDNRAGTREGFPQSVAEDILFMIALCEAAMQEPEPELVGRAG
jgi:pilus assembly protein FimV